MSKMTIKEAAISGFKNYVRFNGRARRSEYWKFILFNALVVLVLILIGGMVSANKGDFDAVGLSGLLAGVYLFATVIPCVSMTCRRLHDVGKSGAYALFYLLPVIGEILILVWLIQDGQPWTNQYGVDPKGRNFGGTSTPMNRCIHCGSPITVGAMFCSNCGKSTNGKSSANRYKFFQCPDCHVKLRVPEGKGNIKIRCVRCGTSFKAWT